MSDAHLLEAIIGRLDDVVHVLRSEPDVAVEFVSPSAHALVSYTPQEHDDDPELAMRIVDPRDVTDQREGVGSSRHDRADHRSFPGTLGRDP